MSEKPETDEFEEEDAEDAPPGGDDVDVDHIMRDVESQRRRAPKGAEPAWRRLERVMEERRTAELLREFDDDEVDDAKETESSEVEAADADADADGDEDEREETVEDERPRRRKKKGH